MKREQKSDVDAFMGMANAIINSGKPKSIKVQKGYSEDLIRHQKPKNERSAHKHLDNALMKLHVEKNVPDGLHIRQVALKMAEWITSKKDTLTPCERFVASEFILRWG